MRQPRRRRRGQRRRWRLRLLAREPRAPLHLRHSAAVVDVPQSDANLSALSASLRSDARDSVVFFGVLGTALESALPECTIIEREHSLFKAKRRARRLTVRLGDDTFTAELGEGRLVCRQMHVVRGVGGGLPYSKALGVEEWIATLVAAVTEDARASAAATAALRSLAT